MTAQIPDPGSWISSVDGVPVVTPPREIDLRNAAQLRDALALAARDHPVVVVDLTANEFCDSSGLAALVHAWRQARAGGGDILLAMDLGVVRRVFKVTGIQQMFRVFGGLAAAVAAADHAGPPGRPDPGAGQGPA
jgi:anti-sigma B factor antagonist